MKANLLFQETSSWTNLTLVPSEFAASVAAEPLVKRIVFGIYKRNGCVYTEIVPNCSRKTLYAIIKGKADAASTIHTDGFRTYDGIVDLGYQKHYRVNHGKDEFAVGTNHINGIEGFAKVRLVKFRGMSKNTFYLHLKECEFRFNYRN